MTSCLSIAETLNETFDKDFKAQQIKNILKYDIGLKYKSLKFGDP